MATQKPQQPDTDEKKRESPGEISGIPDTDVGEGGKPGKNPAEPERTIEQHPEEQNTG